MDAVQDEQHQNYENWLALKMLFRPRKPVNLGPYKLQGLIPSRRNVLSGTIAKTISDELLSSEDIQPIWREFGFITK